MALTYTPATDTALRCPDFRLPTLDGGVLRREDLDSHRGFVFAFICNHCPYVKAIEDRLIQTARELEALDVPLIAVCSNDAADYPEDAFDHLKKRWLEKSMRFRYLHDERQELARAMGAVCTPDFFLFDATGSLFYRGRLDDSWKNPERVQSRDLLRAAARLVAGQKLDWEPSPSMGCSIKWKSVDS